jgi:hypothetical protein
MLDWKKMKEKSEYRQEWDIVILQWVPQESKEHHSDLYSEWGWCEWTGALKGEKEYLKEKKPRTWSFAKIYSGSIYFILILV